MEHLVILNIIVHESTLTSFHLMTINE